MTPDPIETDFFGGQPFSFTVHRYKGDFKVDDKPQAPAQALDLWHRLKREGFTLIRNSENTARWKKDDEVFLFIKHQKYGGYGG